MATITWITKDTIASYLAQIERKGWALREEPTVEQWKLVYHSYEGEFDVYLSVTEEWIYFQVPIFKPGITMNPDCREALCSYLLYLNGEIHFLKFSFDPDEQVVLQVEIPAESFDFKAFRNATQALAIYADRYFAEISIIAHQPEFANFVEQGEFGLQYDDDIEIII